MRRRLQTATVLLATALVGVGLLGCDRGGPSGPTTKEEARSRITGSADVLRRAVVDFGSSPLANMFGGVVGESGMAAEKKALISSLGAVLDTTGGTFNYDASTGVYVWNEADRAWTQERPADSLILRFPAALEPSSSENNGTFTLGAYETKSIPFGGSAGRVPTQLEASLSVDESKVFRVRLKDVDFSAVLGIPQSFALETTVPPLSYSGSLEAPGGASYRYRDRLENDGQLVTTSNASVDVSPDGGGEGAIGRVEGMTQIGQDLTVEYTAEIGTLVNLEGASAQDINDTIDIRVLQEGEQVATLRYDAPAEQVVVVYPDGETEPLPDLLRDLGGR